MIDQIHRFSIPDEITSSRVRDIGGTSFAQFTDPISVYEGTLLQRVYRVDTTKEQRYIIDSPNIDSSTISVLEAQEINGFCQQSNLFFLDAPVSGGTIGAKNATLTFMVGGDQNILNKVENILLTMGSKVVYCGNCGMGQAAKMCNNMILATTMAGVSEAINLSEKINLNTQKLFEVVSTSTAFSWAINNYFPVANIGPESPADNDFKPGFSAELMLKDLSIAIDTKTHFKIETPMTDQSVKLYNLMKEHKMSKMDFSAIINLLKKLS